MMLKLGVSLLSIKSYYAAIILAVIILAIMQYSGIPVHVIDVIVANIIINFMSTLNLTSGYFQIVMKTDDIVQTAFIRSNVLVFAFKRMIFGLSGAPYTFQKDMNIILRPFIR